MTPEIKKRIKQIQRGEVPEGYKKTRAGIIPAEWQEKDLSDVLKKQTKKNADNSVNNLLTNSATRGIIRQTEYFDKQIANDENKEGYYIVKPGYFVYNPRISVGAPCGPFNKYYGETTGIMSPLYTVYKYADDSQYYSEFLSYYFNSSYWHKYMYGIANYGARSDRMNVTSDDMGSLPLPYPSLPEQKKIAEILAAQDRVIELYQRKIDEIKKLKKICLSKMFPQKGHNAPEIRFLEFTDAWEQRKVSEMFRVTRGYVLAATQTETERTDEKPYPVYSSQTKDKGLMGYYKDYLYEDAITWTTDGANAGTVNYRAGKFYCTNVCGVLLSNEVKANQMIAEALNNVAKGYVSYVGNPKLMNNVMADIVIQIPTQAEEREQLSSFFANLDHLITLHQRKLEELQKSKKALMQLLLTGIVRVNV